MEFLGSFSGMCAMTMLHNMLEIAFHVAFAWPITSAIHLTSLRLGTPILRTEEIRKRHHANLMCSYSYIVMWLQAFPAVNLEGFVKCFCPNVKCVPIPVLLQEDYNHSWHEGWLAVVIDWFLQLTSRYHPSSCFPSLPKLASRSV